jgi:hypothetical protein
MHNDSALSEFSQLFIPTAHSRLDSSSSLAKQLEHRLQDSGGQRLPNHVDRQNLAALSGHGEYFEEKNPESSLELPDQCW